MLALCDPEFPMAQWDLLLPQAFLTLNLLRAARCNPKLSAHAYLKGNFNYSATPLAPPGTRVVAHTKSDTRTTWALNGESGWYIGPSPEHYRCVQVYFPRTRTTRHCDTVEFFPTIFKVPKMSLEDYLRQAATDIIALLTNPPSTTTFIPQAGDPIYNALLELAQIFQKADTLPSLPLLKNKPPTSQNDQTVPETRVQPVSETRVHKPTLIEKLNQKRWQQKQLPQSRYSLRSRDKATPFKHMATRQLVAQHIFSLPSISHIYNELGEKQTLSKLLKGPHKKIWNKAFSNEIGRLANGNIHGVSFTNTIEFITQEVM